MNESILIVGGDGVIGSALSQRLRANGYNVLETSRRDYSVGIHLDLSDDLSQWKPPLNISTAIFCTGIASIEFCERNQALTHYVNVSNTLHVVRALIQEGIFVIFLSSSAIFNGEKPFPSVNDQPCPITEYGRQKRDVERGLLNMIKPCSIVRLSKVVYPTLPLLNGWIENLKKGQPIYPFYDSVLAPITLTLTLNVIEYIITHKLAGIVQLSAYVDVSYSTIAYSLARHLGIYNDNLIKSVSYRDRGISFSSRYATLDSSILEKFGFHVPDPFEFLNEVKLEP